MPSTRAGLRLLSLLILAGLLAAALLSQSCETPSSVVPLAQSRPSVGHPMSAGPSPNVDRGSSPFPRGQRGATASRPSRKSVPNAQVPGSPVASVRRNAEVLPAESIRTAAALPPEVQTAIPTDAGPAPATSEGGAALLEVQLGRLARRVLKAYAVDDQVLLPLAAWLQLAEIQHAVEGLRVTGRLQPDRTPFVVDADSGLARIGTRRLSVDSTDLRSIRGEVYGSLRLLSSSSACRRAWTGRTPRSSSTIPMACPSRGACGGRRRGPFKRAATSVSPPS